MEWSTTQDGKYKIESLSASTFPGALEVFREGFFPDEAVCIGTEININPLAWEELLELCADAALDGTSVVAVETDTGKVVACLFNKIQVAPSISSEKPFIETFMEERCKQPSTRALVEFMVELDEQCDFFKRYGVDCTMELMFLGTHPEHRQKGLAKLLVKTSLEIAKKIKDGPVSHVTVEDLGPKYAFLGPRQTCDKVPKVCHGLWSAIGTQKIGKALGFEVITRVPLKDYVYNGKAYTERTGVESFCEGAALRI